MVTLVNATEMLYPHVEPFKAGDDFKIDGDWMPVVYGRYYKCDDVLPPSWNHKHKRAEPISYFVAYYYKWKKVRKVERYWECELHYSQSVN